MVYFISKDHSLIIKANKIKNNKKNSKYGIILHKIKFLKYCNKEIIIKTERNSFDSYKLIEDLATKKYFRKTLAVNPKCVYELNSDEEALLYFEVME